MLKEGVFEKHELGFVLPPEQHPNPYCSRKHRLSLLFCAKGDACKYFLPVDLVVRSVPPGVCTALKQS